MGYNSSMQANLYATFRLLAGIKTIEFDLAPRSTVRQAVGEIVRRYPVLRNHWLDAEGDIYPHVHVFVNGEEVLTLPEGMDTRLKVEDCLDFFPPVAGGKE